jgi:hypothetical protein
VVIALNPTVVVETGWGMHGGPPPPIVKCVFCMISVQLAQL